MTNPIDRAVLAARVLDTICDSRDHLRDSLSDAHGIIAGLAELLSVHADIGGEPLEGEPLRALGKAIRQQVAVAEVFVDHLANHARPTEADSRPGLLSEPRTDLLNAIPLTDHQRDRLRRIADLEHGGDGLRALAWCVQTGILTEAAFS